MVGAQTDGRVVLRLTQMFMHGRTVHHGAQSYTHQEGIESLGHDVRNDPDNPIDPDTSQADDFQQVVTNFISKIAGQETPSNNVWKYLLNLKHNDILKRFAHTLTKYFKCIEKVEKATDKLATAIGTWHQGSIDKIYNIC